MSHPAFSPQRYAQTLQEIFALRRGGKRRGLEGIQALLQALGAPQTRLACVQVAGTNGKGSTAAVLESILHASGVRTGLFTSPHLLHFHERFRLQTQDADAPTLWPHLQKVLDAAASLSFIPLFFEVATALAVEFFAASEVEVAILEVGLGGRLDPTSSVPALCSVISSIGLDHCAWLGDTIPAIAKEKAGILRPHIPVVLGEMTPEALEVIQKHAQTLPTGSISLHGLHFSCSLQRSNADKPPSSAQHTSAKETLDSGTQAPSHLDETIVGPSPSPSQGAAAWAAWQSPTVVRFVSESVTIEEIPCVLRGAFQQHNLALAIQAALALRAHGIQCTPAQIREGARNVRWPGRMQLRTYEGGPLLLDGAHNPQATEALARALPQVPLEVIFGCADDKSPLAMLAPLLAKCARVHLCPPTQTRALPNEHLVPLLQEAFPRLPLCPHPNIQQALEHAHTSVAPQGGILVTGSLFLVADALRASSPSTQR